MEAEVDAEPVEAAPKSNASTSLLVRHTDGSFLNYQINPQRHNSLNDIERDQEINTE